MRRISVLILLFSFSVFGSKTTFGRQCLIVSGSHQVDEKNSGDGDPAHGAIHEMHPQLANETGGLAGLSCRYFDSWSDLTKFVQGTTNGAPNVEKNESLLVAQVAHGHEGGTCACNAGYSSGEEVLGHLQGLSSQHPVFSVMFSCYSGDLLRKKLVSDQKMPSDPSIDHLCLMTGSFFGRGAEGGKSDILSVLENEHLSGMNADEVFLKTDEGLISSAPWSGSGAANYFSGNRFKETEAVLNSIQTLGNSCVGDEVAVASTKDSFSEVIDPAVQAALDTVSTLPDQEISAEALSLYLDELASGIENLKTARILEKLMA